MVDKKTICRHYACAVIGENITELSKYVCAFSKKSSAEHLHRSRVSLRRIHNLVTLFHDVLNLQQIKTWDKKITHSGKALGASRDLDVWIDLLKKHMREFIFLHKASAQKIIFGLQKVHTQEQLCVRRIFLDLKRSEVFKKAVGLFGQRLSYPEKDKALQSMGKQKITKRLKRFMAFRSCVEHPKDGKQLHRMRVAGKKLRYTLESFERVFGPQIKYFYNTVYAMQTALGELHDAEMLVCALKGLKKKGADKETIAAVNYLCDFFTKERFAAYQKFLALWKRSDQQKFWRKLKDFIKRPR